jgi:hypothetical protein
MRVFVRSRGNDARVASSPVRRRGALLLAALSCAVVGSAVAQSGGSYQITRHAVAGGGSRVGGGSFVLVGTVGQAEAAAPATAANLSLTGGFHAPVGAAPNALFSDGFEN